MKTGLTRLRELLHHRTLKLRKMEHMLSLPFMVRLYQDSNTEEIAALEKILEGDDAKALRTWMRTHRTIELGEKGTTELRRIAKRLGIRNWSRLTKYELIALIEYKEEQEYEKVTDACVDGGALSRHEDIPSET
jgi:hypothetical protein